MQQYCIYLRKSRADLELEARGEMETLARHKKTLLELAKRMNLPVTQIYEEIESGETIAARPVVQRLLDEVEQGVWSGVLVMEIERLARGDTIDQGIVARAFKLGHTKIITPAKTYDPDNEFDEEYFEFGLFMSRREYKTINRRIQRGRVASAKEGKFIGSTPPYGYKKIRLSSGKGYTLEPDENEAPVVKQIYGMYVDGAGMSVIARHLDSMGIRPRYSNTWHKTSINEILTNPVYIGKLRWLYNKEVKRKINGQICKRRITNNDPIYVDGLHPAIISVEIFEKAQTVRKANTNKTTKSDLTLQNPLSGVVYCRICGRSMSRLGRSKRKGYDSLRCPNRYCTNVSAPIYMVERKLIDTLRNWLSVYKMELDNEDEASKSDILTVWENALKESERELKGVEGQISSTYDLLEQGVYTVEMFTNRNKELSERREKILEQINNVKKQIETENKMRAVRREQIPAMEGLLDGYFQVESAQDRNGILRSLLTRAEYYKEERNTKGNLENYNFEIHVFPRLLSDCE